MPTEVLTACPVCSSDRLRRRPVPDRWIGRSVFDRLKGELGLVECRRCRFVFANPRPDAAALTAFYSGDEYACHSAGTEDSARDCRYLLDLLGGPTGRLLDYGCGAGAFLTAAAEVGWQAEGYEPGRKGRATATGKGLTVWDDPDALRPNAYAVVVLNHVFEHLPDVSAALARFRGLLAPNGRLVLEVPNAGSLRARLSGLSKRFDERYRAFPIHLSYFRPASLKRLLRSNGWAVELTTVGMGVEELVARPSGPPAEPARPKASGRRPLWKRLVRTAILGTGLGENLLAVCRPK